MKKILLLAIVALVVSTSSFSQVRYGAQVGGALSFAQTEFGTNDDLSNKARLGILAGVIADIPLGPVSFRPEINFIQKGYRNDSAINNASQSTVHKVRLNYVEVPLNFVYNVKAGDGRIFFGLGPNFGLGLSGKDETKRKTSSGGVLTTKETTEDVKFSGDVPVSAYGQQVNYLKRFDFGGNILAGYQFGMGLSVDVQFTLGLIDVSRNGTSVSLGGISIPTSSVNEFSQKNHTLSLKLGYMFGGAKTSTGMKKPASSDSGTF